MRSLVEITELGINELKKLGAEKAKVSASESKVHEFNVDGGEFSLFRTLFNHSLSMTAIKGSKKGSIGVNKLEDEDVFAAAEECIAIAEASTPDDAWDFAPDNTHEKFFEENIKPDLDLLFRRSRELLEDIQKRFPKIMVEQMIISHAEKYSVYRNTSGALYEENEGTYGIDLMFSAHEGELSSSFFGVGVTTDKLDKPFIELGSIEKDLGDVEKQIETKPVDGKFEGTILLTPDSFCGFLSSAIDNFTGEKTVLEKTSIWLDKVGKKVADERLTVSFPIYVEGVPGRDNFTAEGYLCEDFTLIENGVLTTFPISLYVANKTGFPVVKNNTDCMVVTPGEKSLEEIIASIDKGLIVGRFSGGAPGISGEFSGVAKNSFLIENGKITDAVSETMISGNLNDMLNNIVAISKDTVCDGSNIMPYAAFGGITISGK